MRFASGQYNIAMAKQFRDRAYAMITVGVVNQAAQGSANFSSISYLSNSSNPLSIDKVLNTYASFEEKHTRADGNYIFPPENNEYLQVQTDVGVVAENIGGTIRISFGLSYNIKGLTFNFGESYPTEFIVSNGKVTNTYTLDNPQFICQDNFDRSSYLDITPISFIDGNNKRLRINYALMGVGLNFTNDNIADISISEDTSYVSESLPSAKLSVKILDYSKLFNVDNTNSFINYLEDGQPLEVAIGQTLENGTVEYIDLPTFYLSDWGSNGRQMSFSATDRIALLDGQYSAGNKIHTRTLYDDAIAVLTAAGLEPDEYFVDSCLEDFTVTNPLPTASFAECLQLIANAGRCSFKQGLGGKIMLQGNFENIIEPTDLQTYANEEAGWSNADNVRFGTELVYADFTHNFVPADGSMMFLPEDSGQYLLDETTFVSKEISDDNGKFSTNPTVTLELPARYTYFGIRLVFNDNAPSEFSIKTYYDNIELDTFDYFYSVPQNDVFLYDSFIAFNKMEITFKQTEARNRLLLKGIYLGEITDYRLDKFSMLEEPVGILDKKVKDVSVKVFSFTEPEKEGEDPKVVEDSIYYTNEINTTGQTVTFENQLIGSLEHAQKVAEWMSNYYANNITYSLKYRGDPRLEAGDVIYMDSDYLNNLQVEIESLELNFNGALSGKLNLRRATNMLKENA